VDEQNRLLVNGEPFFPIGIYNPLPDDFALIAKMGFNCAGPYLTATAECVAEAKKHGLRLISNAPRGEDRWVQQAADSGVLLAYYVYDEPTPQEADTLRERCSALAKMDPYHPTCGCNNLHHGYYTDVADVMMVDAYPHPGSFDVIVDRMKTAVRVMKGRRPVWYIPQAFARLGYMHAGSTLENSREPTYDELRAATWLGIALGARGVIYYSDRIQTFAIRYAFPLLWRALGYTVAELRALDDVLLWPRVEMESSDSNVYASGAAFGDKLFVVAVNAATNATQATLSLPAHSGHALRVLGEDRVVECAGGKLTDNFGPKTAHLYASWPMRSPVDVVAAREDMAKRRAQQQRRWQHNVALFYRGASLEASWGFPKDVRGLPWLRMIDGYRGTTWPLGSRGLLPRSYRFPPAIRATNRWIQVRFPKPMPLDRAVVVTSPFRYAFAVRSNDDWRQIEPTSEKQSNVYGPPAIVRTFPLGGMETDRVRLIIPHSPTPGQRERYYEIEVYRVVPK